MKKKVFRISSILIASVFILMAWSSGSDEEPQLNTKEKALDYLQNSYSKHHGDLPYGKYKFLISGNKLMYWDNLDEGWTNQPKATYSFKLVQSTDYEMDYSENKNVEIKVWDFELEDAAYDSDMSWILPLQMDESGCINIRGCSDFMCISTRGWEEDYE